MSAFVLMEEGVVINRTAAQQGKIPLAAWDIGNFDDSRFLSTEPNPQLSVARKDDLRKIWNEKWQLSRGAQENQIIVTSSGQVLGQINRRAAAVLAPLLDADVISIDVKSNQEADGQRNKALHVYALLGNNGNKQIVREPTAMHAMRAYIALLACTMKALKSSDNLDLEKGGEPDQSKSSDVSDELSTPWDRLPGSICWDYATGSIGNTVNRDLVNQLGSRTLAFLRSCSAELPRARIN